MAIITIDAETGDTSQWSSLREDGGNTLTATMASLIHGVYGFALDFAGTDKDLYGRYDFSSAQDDVYIRFYFNIQELGLPDNQFIDLFDVLATWDTDLIAQIRLYQIGVGTTLGYRLYIDGNLVINKSTTVTFTEGTEYYVELHHKVDGSVGGWEFWIDGSSEGSDFALDTTGNSINNISIGSRTAATPSSSGLIYVDDIEADTSYIGAYPVSTGIEILRRRIEGE